jgi:hypothetical protein
MNKQTIFGDRRKIYSFLRSFSKEKLEFEEWTIRIWTRKWQWQEEDFESSKTIIGAYVDL